jgi:hypothetical protein
MVECNKRFFRAFRVPEIMQRNFILVVASNLPGNMSEIRIIVLNHFAFNISLYASVSYFISFVNDQ